MLVAGSKVASTAREVGRGWGTLWLDQPGSNNVISQSQKTFCFEKGVTFTFIASNAQDEMQTNFPRRKLPFRSLTSFLFCSHLGLVRWMRVLRFVFKIFIFFLRTNVDRCAENSFWLKS